MYVTRIRTQECTEAFLFTHININNNNNNNNDLYSFREKCYFKAHTVLGSISK